MTRYLRVVLASVALVIAASIGAQAVGDQAAPSAAPSLADDLQKDWVALKDTMAQLGGAMPPDKFGFKPVPELRSFAEQLTHVAQVNVTFMRGLDPKATPPALNYKATAKDEVLKVLAASFDFGAQVMKGHTSESLLKPADGPRFLGPSTGARLVWRAMAHTWDEYGVMTVYLRLNGIVPPASRR